MKKAELALIVEENDLNATINKKFEEWDKVYLYGSSDGFVSDGFVLNCLRNDILQLRAKRDRLYAQPMVGQLCLDGGEISAEREPPEQMPFGWMAPASADARLQNLRERMKTLFE